VRVRGCLTQYPAYRPPPPPVGILIVPLIGWLCGLVNVPLYLSIDSRIIDVAPLPLSVSIILQSKGTNICINSGVTPLPFILVVVAISMMGRRTTGLHLHLILSPLRRTGSDALKIDDADLPLFHVVVVFSRS